MADELRSLDDILEHSDGFDPDELDRIRADRLLGASAILLRQQGEAELSGLAADVTEAKLHLWNTGWGEPPDYRVELYVEPHLLARFTEEVLERLAVAMSRVAEQNMDIESVIARPVVPRVSADWRQQLRAASGPQPTNQARRVRLEPQHPMHDGLHFTNEWEYKVYVVLKEHQASLPDDETIGIMPLGAMRVLGHTYEPDLLITYKGRVGVIEIDGPHHKGRASDDTSRARLLRNAGVRHIDRLDVRDTTEKAEVQKFVQLFLKHLTA